MKRTLSVLGSTGSIGRQTLEVAQACGLTVAALTANRNSLLLEEQARKFRPKLVAAVEESAAADLKVRLADTPSGWRPDPGAFWRQPLWRRPTP